MLKDRLNNLRRQSGAQPAANRTAPAASVAERIVRLRPNSSDGKPKRPASLDDEALTDRLGGRLIAPGVILIERETDLDARHGRHPLNPSPKGRAVLPDARSVDPAGLLFFDTETSGLAGGSGTVAFMLGMGRVIGERLKVRQYLLTAFSGERAMLEAAGAWLEGCTALVSFNGKSFDAPLLATRHRLAGLTDPFATLPHIDLLAPTRRAFASRWSDCRLATAERELLGFHRIDDLPGAEAPAAWLDWLRMGDGGRLSGVADHNHWDILSLAALLPLLGEVHADPVSWNADVTALARARLRDDDEAAAFRLLMRAGSSLDGAGRLALARLHRRRGEWDAARLLWERLAEEGEAEALEQLAKYHEHRRRDYGEAMRYARRLPKGDPGERRLLRLERKLGGAETFQSRLF